MTYSSFNQETLQSGANTRGILKSNYGLFNRNNIYIRSWSWNYRGCWHQTCPPIDNHQFVWVNSPLQIPLKGNAIFRRCLAICWHWAICAPAADHSHGCRLSGTLSGIEPQSPVTRQRQGSPLHYLQHLIGGKFVQRRTKLCFRNFGLRQQLQLLCSSVYFCFGQSHRPPHFQVSPWCLIASDFSYRY